MTLSAVYPLIAILLGGCSLLAAFVVHRIRGGPPGLPRRKNAYAESVEFDQATLPRRSTANAERLRRQLAQDAAAARLHPVAAPVADPSVTDPPFAFSGLSPGAGVPAPSVAANLEFIERVRQADDS